MVNNFEQLTKLLKFENKDHFYFLQILKRPKDGHNIGSHGILVKNYFIDSLEYLESKKEEIIDLCEKFNARAYLRLNRRSYRQCAIKSAMLTLEYIDNKNERSAKKAFITAAGKYHCEPVKNWIVDIDEQYHIDILSEIVRFINDDLLPDDQHKIIEAIKTKYGVHLISKPFNVKDFKERYSTIDIHKDNPTILYCP